MPRYYCDYCDAYLTHDSAVVRKQHNSGYKHKSNVKAYYLQFDEENQARLIAELNGFPPGPAPGIPGGMGMPPPHMLLPPRPGMPMPPGPFPGARPGMTPFPRGMPFHPGPRMPMPPGQPPYASGPSGPGIAGVRPSN